MNDRFDGPHSNSRASGATLTALRSVLPSRVIVVGEIDLSTAEVFREAIRAAEETVGDGELVIDLRGVSFMDASGVAAIVGAAHRARTRGGRVSVRAHSRSVRWIAALVGLNQLARFDPPLSEDSEPLVEGLL